MRRASYGEPTCWLTCAVVDEAVFGVSALELCSSLSEQNIEARPTWKPMHMQPVFAQAELVGGEVCEELYAQGICLPSGSSLSPAEQDRVVAAVLGTPTNR